ncbi:MAG: sulfotransferase [Chloroflexi bacterium]|nr:sulfotransferase [Chloroflexota bacterium]
MALLLCGHQRSGTSLLRLLCNGHPEITITREFGNFMDLGTAFPQHARSALQHWWHSPFRPSWHNDQRRGVINMPLNLWFVLRYLQQLSLYRNTLIQASHIEIAMKKLLPGSRVVGDKYPDYAFLLDRLVPMEGIRCVVIYRDPRDVASSSVQKARTEWRNAWPPQMREAKHVAERWMQQVKLMDSHARKIHIIRFESLVTDPQPVLEGLGEWLGVDPKGFPHEMVSGAPIGNYRQGLTAQEVQDVISVAGPMMESLGYL